MKTKTTRSRVSHPLLDELFGDDVGPALYRYLRDDVELRTGAARHPDLDRELDELVIPKWFSPIPGRYAVFSLPELDRFLRFTRKLRHIKGRWAGHPFELDLWQVVFVAAPLFGWRNLDGTRVFRALHLEIPRKNGKSTLAAAIALFLLTEDGEQGAEVYSAATDRTQARAVFDVAAQMARRAPAVRKRCRVNRGAIVDQASASSYRVLSADAFRQHGLNVHGAVIDELHVHKNRDLVEVLESGTGSRSQPLIATLTTAGLDDPGSIYTEKRDYSEKVARELWTRELADPDNPDSGFRSLVEPRLEDPELLAVIYTVEPDVMDPFAAETWRAANPGYGRSISESYLRSQARKAKASGAALNGFLRLHLNVRTGQIVRWISLDKWDASGARHLRPTDDQLRGRIAYGGLDLASAADLAAVALVVPVWRPDPDDPDRLIEDLDVVIRAWTPAGTLRERAERDRAPYLDWVRDGWLKTTPGEVIDYDVIEADIELLVSEIGLGLELRRLHFDRWGSKQLIGHIRDKVGAGAVFEMGQGFASMSAPMKELEKIILESRLRHAANPLLRWAVASLAVAVDPAENIKPDRDKSTGRIDPFVALVMAVDAWTRDHRGRSRYEDDDEEVEEVEAG